MMLCHLKKCLSGWELSRPWASQFLHKAKGSAGSMPLICKPGVQSLTSSFWPLHGVSNTPPPESSQGQLGMPAARDQPTAQSPWNYSNQPVLNCLPALLGIACGNSVKLWLKVSSHSYLLSLDQNLALHCDPAVRL